MAYVDGDEVLMFGGLNESTRFNDTWVYDLSADTWTQKSPSTSPPVRDGAALAYGGGDQVLLFAGTGSNGGALGDTWVYDLSAGTWMQDTTGASPGLRFWPKMAYIGDDQVLLFGGSGGGGAPLNESWVYDLSAGTWTQMTQSPTPSARVNHDMAYIGDDQVLMFGGNSGIELNDTWVYDLSDNSWTLKSPSNPIPTERTRHGMAYVGGDQVLMFGGWGGGTLLDDTWLYDLSAGTWTQQSPVYNPTGRHFFAMATIGGNQALMFGGHDGSQAVNDTWVYGEILPKLRLATSDALFCTGQSTDVYVNLDDAENLYGHQFTVSYDATMASAVGYWDYSFFDTNPPGTNGYVPDGWNATCAAGTCKFARTETSPDPAVSGSGQLAKITLTAVSPGTFSMIIGDDILSDVDGAAMDHAVGAPLPITTCGWATVSGKVTMQGRPGNNVNVGTVTLTEQTPTHFSGPYSGAFSASDGTFSIPMVPYMPGGSSYNIAGLHGLYLTSDKIVTIFGDLSGQNTRLWAGDANNDTLVTITDLACIGLNFGGPPGTCGTTGSSDINADTTTNIRDLVLAGGNFGKTSPRAW